MGTAPFAEATQCEHEDNLGWIQNEFRERILKICEQLHSGFGDDDHIAMAQAAISIKVSTGLDIEDHAWFEDIVGSRVQTGFGQVIDRGKADAVPGRMFEL